MSWNQTFSLYVAYIDDGSHHADYSLPLNAVRSLTPPQTSRLRCTGPISVNGKIDSSVGLMCHTLAIHTGKVSWLRAFLYAYVYTIYSGMMVYHEAVVPSTDSTLRRGGSLEFDIMIHRFGLSDNLQQAGIAVETMITPTESPKGIDNAVIIDPISQSIGNTLLRGMEVFTNLMNDLSEVYLWIIFEY